MTFGHRRTFAGRNRDGTTRSVAGHSVGHYVTNDLMLLDGETAKKAADEKVRKELGWIYFRSKHEAKCWIRLRQMEKAGLITDLKRQVKYNLCCPTAKDPGALFDLPPSTVTTYAADFEYIDENGRKVTADAKGWPTPEYDLKKKWLKLQHGIDIVEM